MARKITVTVKGKEKVIAVIQRMHHETEFKIKQATSIRAYEVQRISKANLASKSDTGALRSSIVPKFENGGMAARIGVAGTANKYAKAVEYGTKPHPSAGSAEAARKHFPPPKALRPWMKRRGIDPDLDFLIARKIYLRGIAAHPYLMPAFKEVQPKYEADIKKICKNMAK